MCLQCRCLDAMHVTDNIVSHNKIGVFLIFWGKNETPNFIHKPGNLMLHGSSEAGICSTANFKDILQLNRNYSLIRHTIHQATF